MPIIPADPSGIAQAVKALKRGECIGLPTETVYGLAADGLNPHAVSKIFEIKKRPSFDPLILHIPAGYDISTICIPNSQASLLMQKFWPGALTIILPKKDRVPDIVTSGLSTVAIRCPSHPVSQEALKAFASPIAAPSANRFGRISPTTAEAVHAELGNAINIILDGGPCEIGLESTIVDCTQSHPRILRQGAITLEEIKKVISKAQIFSPKDKKIVAPGTTESHYAPLMPLYISKEPLFKIKALPPKYAYLFWQKISPSSLKKYRCLTPEGSTRQAAVNLFQYLRELDDIKPDAIIADLAPPEGLGAAINDRLIRASLGAAEWVDKDFLFTQKKS